MNAKIKVLLVDDHAVVRAGFKLLLSVATSGIEVVAEGERGEEVVRLYQHYLPDVVVMDLSMPGIGGLETIRRVLQRDALAKIVVFSVHDELVYVRRAFAAGAKGYLSKRSAPEDLPAAIEAVWAGLDYIDSRLQITLEDVLDTINSPSIVEQLTAREFDIFRMLVKGWDAHKIADELCLGYKTVANYITQIKKKMQVSSLAELAHIAVVSGVLKR